ncbi:coiled-coil domain-containing protein 87-like isoform X4 [Styela clava]
MVSKLVAERYSHGLTKTRGLYDIADAENEQWEARRQQLNSLGALSLFTQQEDAVEEKTPKLQFDSVRPITPINDSIKSAPKTYPSFSKLIYRRINPRPEWNHISKEDQSSLGAVIMGEVNAIWPVLRRQVSDPFLTHQQNKELQRRITVHCVTVCEQLFIHYADKVKILNSRGVFSNPANLSRIRAQLALDAGKYLNILSIRRHIISDLKKPSTKEVITYNRDEVIAPSPVTPMTTESPKQELSFRDLVKSSRPRRKMKYQFNLKAEINSMQSQMPTISRSKIHQLQPLAKQEPFIYADEQEDESNMEDDSDMIESARREEKDLEIDDDHISVSSYPIILEHRCPSEPLGQHTLLIEELRQRQEEEDEIIMKSPSTILPSRQRIHSVTPIVPLEHQQKCRTSLGLERVLHDDSRDVDSLDPKEDLRLLMERQERERKKERESQERTPTDPSTHIPPLIQALTRREAQDEKVRKLKIKEKELDMKYKEELEEKMKPLPEPQYPQPAVVQTKLPGVSNPVDRTAITIRASDVKLNDHVDLSTVTLGSYQPVYNDLKGDISQATVKELDANLFQGGELKEVYSEIMKTVPNIHQHYDNDPLIVTPGTNVDLSQILASSTLVRPSSQQVINPKLRRYEFDMPWQGQQMMWMKSTTHPQSGYPESDASSMTQAHGECVMPFHRFTPSQLNHPGVEKGSRAYASWLQWWKNTINTDDFFKYLSTQDTDFLSVLFHFYDSDAADSETESMRTAKMDAQKERDKKLTALKKEKEEFVAGLWNVKAVTLGGLGKDPEMEEEEFSDFGTPRLSDRSQSISQLGSRSMRDSGTPRSTRSESMHKGTTVSSKSHADSREVSTPSLTIQERLEIVWQKLKMPDSQKLNFALKYSSDKYIKKLPEIVRSWERVTDFILQREKLMTNLEVFEKEASDPNRFFERGHRGSSAMRLDEAKMRANLHRKLEAVESTIKSCLISLKSRFSDTVTYNGRPYLEKMGWDKIEMLYFLQQERRCTMLKDHGHPEQLDLFLHVNQQTTPNILPPSGRRYIKLPLKSVKLTGP